MIRKLRDIFQNEIIRVDLKSKSSRRRFVIRQIRIYVYAFRGFFEDRAALRASSLTYFTMLSIVPIFAMAFGIAKGFGFEDRMNEFIDNSFQEQDQMITWIKTMVASLLDNTKGGLVAGIGFIILFWSVIQVLNNIELSFNDIWQVKKARSPIRKFSDYLAMMIITPFAIALSGSITVKINQAANNFEFIQPMLKVVPYASIWLLFTVIYIVMPNTKVKFKYALVAGIVAGTLSMLVQWGYFEFQIGVTRFNTLYGSFAAIPLFLLWLQITWLIVLMGAEISFAYQNIENYEFEDEALELNHDNKRVLSLVVAHHIIRNFEEGGRPKSNEDLSHELGIPLRLLNQLIFDMVECGILAELANDSSKLRTYQPAIDINKITVNELYTRLEKLGGDHMIATESAKLDKITKIHEHLQDAIRESPSNILVKDI
ncbi:MAG: YihY/virulence factor BrkB family protein [Bacteroidales bacterium]|nr:YihY/virulence factor BrkB family protein [Bacteroidales bacterium]